MKRWILALLPLLTASCTVHSVAREFNGLDGIRGEPVEYQSSTAYALHFLFVIPAVGDGRLETVVDDFTAEASARGAQRVHISDTSSIHWWFLPPVPLLFYPVTTTVEGTVMGSATDVES